MPGPAATTAGMALSSFVAVTMRPPVLWSPSSPTAWKVHSMRGSPSFTVDLEMEGEDGDHNTGGLIATAMRIINAIPFVCAAPPGLLSSLDLPLFGAKHLMPT